MAVTRGCLRNEHKKSRPGGGAANGGGLLNYGSLAAPSFWGGEEGETLRSLIREHCPPVEGEGIYAGWAERKPVFSPRSAGGTPAG